MIVAATAPMYEIVVSAGLFVGLGVLRMIRDWPARRRLNAVIVADVEHVMLARKQIRDVLVGQSIRGDAARSAGDVNDLFKLDVLQAMYAVGDTRSNTLKPSKADQALHPSGRIRRTPTLDEGKRR
ncbi:hypothetical protein A5638_14835 [Mycolicibacterium fortuitum]|nr:hypothetical protein A5638_14835 [Mycolicibacterium fortuitum]